MDETTNNFTWTNTISSTDVNTAYFSNFEYTSWQPYTYEKYHPEWHITQGYKIQIRTMWK